jgi:hypothetical protein
LTYCLVYQNRDFTISLTEFGVLGFLHALQVKISYQTQMFPLSGEMISVKLLHLRKIFLSKRPISTHFRFVTCQPEGLSNSTRRLILIWSMNKENPTLLERRAAWKATMAQRL